MRLTWFSHASQYTNSIHFTLSKFSIGRTGTALRSIPRNTIFSLTLHEVGTPWLWGVASTGGFDPGTAEYIHPIHASYTLHSIIIITYHFHQVQRDRQYVFSYQSNKCFSLENSYQGTPPLRDNYPLEIQALKHAADYSLLCAIQIFMIITTGMPRVCGIYVPTMSEYPLMHEIHGM